MARLHRAHQWRIISRHILCGEVILWGCSYGTPPSTWNNTRGSQCVATETYRQRYRRRHQCTVVHPRHVNPKVILDKEPSPVF